MKRFNKNPSVLLSVLIAGAAVRIDPASIPKENRKVFHGEFKGTQVNSPATYEIGESVILWPDASKSFAVSMPKADMGVLATQFLKAEGFNVTAAA